MLISKKVLRIMFLLFASILLVQVFVQPSMLAVAEETEQEEKTTDGEGEGSAPEGSDETKEGSENGAKKKSNATDSKKAGKPSAPKFDAIALGFPEDLTESLGCSMCEIVSSRISKMAEHYTKEYTRKSKKERKEMAEQIVNGTCFSFANNSEFVIDGKKDARRFYDLNSTLYSYPPKINSTKGESVDKYFDYLCHGYIGTYGKSVSSYVSRFYKDKYDVRKTIKAKLCKYVCPKKPKPDPYKEYLKKMSKKKAVKTTGEDCLLASMKAIGDKKWNKAKKKALCSGKNE